MAALGRVLPHREEPAPQTDDVSQANPWVHALRVEPGEVSLELRGATHCEAHHMADAAFQTLRSLLPDTDIYVRHVH
jgi:hypothetical protein